MYFIYVLRKWWRVLVDVVMQGNCTHLEKGEIGSLLALSRRMSEFQERIADVKKEMAVF